MTALTHLDFLAYQAVDAVNWSTLRYATQSGIAYRHCLDSATPETDAMRLGRGAHALVFEPDAFEREFVYWFGGRRAGGEWEQFKGAHLTKTILKGEDEDTIEGIARAVHAHPVAGPLLAEGQAECTVTWTDKDTGIACKGRMDWLSDLALVDLKTTRDIEVLAFGRHAAGLLYHCQLAFYSMGLFAHGLKPAVKIIAVESDPPHDVAVFDLNEDVLWAGEVKVREALRLVKRCREDKRWPGRYAAEVEFALPGYAFPSEDETDAAMRGSDD